MRQWCENKKNVHISQFNNLERLLYSSWLRKNVLTYIDTEILILTCFQQSIHLWIMRSVCWGVICNFEWKHWKSIKSWRDARCSSVPAVWNICCLNHDIAGLDTGSMLAQLQQSGLRYNQIERFLISSVLLSSGYFFPVFPLFISELDFMQLCVLILRPPNWWTQSKRWPHKIAGHV